MESAGVALALLPIMLNQLDNYVQGLQTLKSFRTRRYRQYLERYAAMLGGQHAMLVNTLGLALGKVHSPDESRNFLSEFHALWNDPWTEEMLRLNLGTDYKVFLAVISQASKTLEELATKLNWTAKEPATIPWNDKNALLHEAQRIKHICSRSIYDNLFNNLSNANNILKTLVDQSVEKDKRQNQLTGISSWNHQMIRQTARSVHKALIGGKCWTCACRDQHGVRFILDDNFEDPEKLENIAYHLVMTAIASDSSNQMASAWHEVEIEHSRIRKRALETTCPDQCKNAEQSTTPIPPLLDSSRYNPNTNISDACSSLHKIHVQDGKRELVGYLLDDTYRHRVYLVKKETSALPCHTLEDIILSSASFPWDPKATLFNRRIRLQLAIKLAYGVLHFHDSWLRTRWRTRDIQFPQQSKFEEPFLAWGIANLPKNKAKMRSSSIIGNETLFPLGMVLIELSLCNTIGALVLPEDENPDEEVTLLKTARRCLDKVYMESGTRYGDVVQQCLFWSHTRDLELDNEEHQKVIFQHVVYPLVKELKSFDGVI